MGRIRSDSGSCRACRWARSTSSARRVLKLVDGRTVQLSPMAEDEGLRLRRIAGWIREELDRDPGLAADVALRRNARSAVVKDGGEPVERHRIPPDGREVKSHGEVVIGTLLHTAGVPFVYEASFPLPAGKAGGAAGADAPPEDLRGYRPDFYLPDDPAAPVTAAGGVWLEHYAHDRRGRAPAEFAGYEEARARKRRLHESLATRYVETSLGDLYGCEARAKLSRDPSAGRDREPVCEPHDSTGEPGAGNRHAGFGERGEETCPRKSACGPAAKAPDEPPMPYRLRASPRLYTTRMLSVPWGQRRRNPPGFFHDTFIRSPSKERDKFTYE